jgi:hypothetical protein
MKKLLFVCLFITSILAGNIKTDDTIIGIHTGSIKLSNDTDSEKDIGVKLGYYFYDPNKYIISNRLYFEASRILKDNSSLYSGELNLDWIFNQLNYIKPFIGANLGYLYDNDNNDNSTSFYGFNAGILIYLGDFIELEGGAKINHPLNNDTKDLYPDNFKKIYGSINFSF